MCRSSAIAPHGPPDATFHFVLAGRCSLVAPDLITPVELHAGDLMVVQRGSSHRPGTVSIQDAARVEPERCPLTPEQCAFPGSTGVAGASLLCGYFVYPGGSPIATMLPPFVHIRADGSAESGEIRTTIAALAEESESARVGHHAVVRRLVEVLFIRVFRASVARLDESLVTLAAVRDKQIGKVLAEMHSNPHTDWTIDDLARMAASSRSAFSSRFTSLVGLPPLRYLTSLRMTRAKELLLTQPMSVSQVSEAIGYGSVQAFTRAFKRSFAITPAEFRATNGRR